MNELVESVKDKYYCDFMDNFFSSILLFLQLLSEKTYACGIFRSNRNQTTKVLAPVMKRGLPNKGVFGFQNKVVAVWQDTKPLLALSTNWDVVTASTNSE